MADCPESGGWHELPDDQYPGWHSVPKEPESVSPAEVTIAWYVEEMRGGVEQAFSVPPTEDELIDALGYLRVAAAMLRDRADMKLAVSKALTYGTLHSEIEAFLKASGQ